MFVLICLRVQCVANVGSGSLPRCSLPRASWQTRKPNKKQKRQKQESGLAALGEYFTGVAWRHVIVTRHVFRVVSGHRFALNLCNMSILTGVTHKPDLKL